MIITVGIVLLVGVLCDVAGKPVSACNKDEFPCNDGSCILKILWCNGELNCQDKSDEKFCFFKSNLRPVPNNCDETFFRCENGPCIPLVGRCDGQSACLDGSDEKGCPTEKPTELHYSGVTFFEYFDDNNTTAVPQAQHFVQLTEKNETEVTETMMQVTLKFDHGDIPQADSGSSDIKTTADDLSGFVNINPKDFKHERMDAGMWLLSVRDKDYGWGDETPRALTALYMAKDDLIMSKQHDLMLMSKQLHVQLFMALIRNRTTPIPLWDLSLFINALSATCDDPRNFYGQDLVEILRQRTDNTATQTFVSPVVYLTLCLNGATSRSDVEGLVQVRNYTMNKIDTEALVSLCATCISRIPKFASYHPVLLGIPTRFYQRVVQPGLPNTVYKLALAAQALSEARINHNKWNRSEVLRRIVHYQDRNGSFGDILSTYYSIPVLSGESILSLRRHCPQQDEDLTPLEILKNGDAQKINVKYSLYFGEPVEVSQTLMLRVKNETNFLDVMRIGESINPVYKFNYDMNEGKPTIYSIGGVVNDPERGLYWKLHVASSFNSTGAPNLVPHEEDVRTFKPQDGDTVVFWMKSLY